MATSRGLVRVGTLPNAERLEDQEILELRFSDGGAAARTLPRLFRPAPYLQHVTQECTCPRFGIMNLLTTSAGSSETAASPIGAQSPSTGLSGRSRTAASDQTLLAQWDGFVPKPSVQASGTRQLRLMRRSFVDYLGALGAAKAKAADKIVPLAVLQAPEQCLTAFLRGLFDADGCVVNDLKKGTRYVGLGSRSPALLRTVQSLLLSPGVRARIYCTSKSPKPSFTYTRGGGTRAIYGSGGPSFDLRVSGPSLSQFADVVGFRLRHKRDALTALLVDHSFYRSRDDVRVISSCPQGSDVAFAIPSGSSERLVDGFR